MELSILLLIIVGIIFTLKIQKMRLDNGLKLINDRSLVGKEVVLERQETVDIGRRSLNYGVYVLTTEYTKVEIQCLYSEAYNSPKKLTLTPDLLKQAPGLKIIENGACVFKRWQS